MKAVQVRSLAEVEALSTPALVDLYNQLSVNSRPVKRFESRAVGIERTWAAVEAALASEPQPIQAEAPAEPADVPREGPAGVIDFSATPLSGVVDRLNDFIDGVNDLDPKSERRELSAEEEAEVERYFYGDINDEVADAGTSVDSNAESGTVTGRSETRAISRQEKKAGVRRGGRRLELEFLPSEKRREPLPGTKRERLLDLARRPGGALLSELLASHGGNRRSGITAVKALHEMIGFGLYSEPAGDNDLRVWAYEGSEDAPTPELRRDLRALRAS